MTTYRVEVLGKVPYGLTHNDVFASFNSLMRDYANVKTLTKRRLKGDHVSLVVVFDAPSKTSAVSQVVYCANGVTNFSYDVIGPREVP